MIDLLTLYLGLTVGVQPVEVLAAPQVARVEVLLDGAPAAQLDIGQLDADDPALVDFGAKLAPHRLEVVAFGDGGELGRQSQDVNLAPGAAFAVGTPETRTPILVPSGSRRRGVTAKELDGRLRAAARPVPVLAVDGGDGGWVIDRHVHHHRALLAASDRLRHSLDRQRVAWVEGRYLPQEIELVDGPIEGRRP